jgi:Xaa-Pro aminopeptidase
VTRIEHLRGLIQEPFLVTTPVNVRYLTGFESSNAAVLVDEERVLLFTDFRYAEAARQVEDVEFVEVERALIRGVAARVQGTVGFESAHLTFASWELLRNAGLELVPRGGEVEQLRAVKEPEELQALQKAAAITTQAYERIATEPFVGHTERELGFRFDQILQELGAHGNSFPTVFASGPNGASPHTHSGERVIEPGELVVVDAGATIDGYCADCTRTFATGDLPDELQHAYDICLAAQLAGLRAVAPTITGRQADAAARGVIDAAGLGEFFGHGLGHGVGLLVHEAPTLRPESEDTLVANNVVTVEPGIYLPGIGGVRIEDLVVVSDSGPRVLTPYPKELQTVG